MLPQEVYKVGNMDRTSLIYNCTQHPSNNHARNHTNGYAWDDDDLYRPLPLHDGGDGLAPYVVYGVLLRWFYVHLPRAVLQDLQGHHVELQMLVLLSLK